MNGCNNNTLCAIRGPVMLIALGALLAVHQMTAYSIFHTWPLLLILLGLLKLIERMSDNSDNPSRPTTTGGGV